MSETETSQEFQSITEVRELVEEFENCTLARSEWNHRAHLTVALWYLMHHEESQATSAVIAGIQRYNRAHRIKRSPKGGYHETLTLFWLAVACDFLATAIGGSELERINAFIGAFYYRKNLALDYYSRDLIWSWRARYSWVEPDLKPLDLGEMGSSNCPAPRSAPCRSPLA